MGDLGVAGVGRFDGKAAAACQVSPVVSESASLPV